MKLAELAWLDVGELTVRLSQVIRRPGPLGAAAAMASDLSGPAVEVVQNGGEGGQHQGQVPRKSFGLSWRTHS